MTHVPGHYLITNGPSKFDLMLSLFDGNKKPRRTVTFQIQGGPGEIEVAVTMVRQEDGSGESWLFGGHCHNSIPTLNVNGYFNTRSRKGWLDLAHQ